MRAFSKIKAAFRAIRSRKAARRLVLWALFSLVIYVVAYGILIGQGEQRARRRDELGYDLAFSGSKYEKYESVVCAFFWPIYSVDSVYADEGLYPRAMIPKNATLLDYVEHCKCRLLDCLN